MWQALLAAAVAGSTGIVAKHFFKPHATADQVPKLCSDEDQGVSETNHLQEEKPQLWSASAAFGSDQLGVAHASIGEEPEDGIFRFSSTGPRGNGSRIESRNLSKKRGNSKGHRLTNGVGSEERPACLEQRSARKLGFCLKRRKISKNVAAKRGSSCSSNDTSLFGWGLGFGIMYMMSAGKAEFSKLNTAMSETAKVVQELKAELRKRKSIQNLQVSGYANEVISNHHITSFTVAHQELSKLSANNIGPNFIKSFSPPMINDGECASSVLTEEPLPGVQEMDQLEAELELELQKLPWSTIEASSQEGSKDLIETEVLTQGFPEQERQASESDTHQMCGILPAELDQKLCHLLIERQENQIEELESELHSAQCKLHEKESELQALKDCVKRLTEFSISTLSDDETEADIEQEQTSDWNYKKVGSDSKNPGVGMKRPIDSKFM